MQEPDWVETLVNVTSTRRTIVLAKAFVAHALTVRHFAKSACSPQLLDMTKLVCFVATLTNPSSRILFQTRFQHSQSATHGNHSFSKPLLLQQRIFS